MDEVKNSDDDVRYIVRTDGKNMGKGVHANALIDDVVERVERPWELVLAPLGEEAWDEATELASMLSDECYPDIMRDDISRAFAASAVLKLCTDPDWRRCIEGLLATVHNDGKSP